MKQRKPPGWLGVGLGAAAGFLVGVVLIVALGGAVQTKTVVHAVTHRTTSTRTVTITPPDPNVVAVPDLVGDSLDDAQQQLDDLDLDEQDDGGGLFGVLDPSNWQVIDTHPKAGAKVKRGSVVLLDVEHD